MQADEGGAPPVLVEEELLLELEEEELEDALPPLELDELLLELDELLLELEEEELEDALPLLELDEDELLLELDDDVPPVTVRDVIVGRPLPLPQTPNDSVPPFAPMDAL
jgi:hypothetical protein